MEKLNGKNIILMNGNEYEKLLRECTDGGINLHYGSSSDESYFYAVSEDYIGDDEEIFEIVGENLDVTVNNIFVDTEKDQVVIITD